VYAHDARVLQLLERVVLALEQHRHHGPARDQLLIQALERYHGAVCAVAHPKHLGHAARAQ
jgi:hypothetical protein